MKNNFNVLNYIDASKLAPIDLNEEDSICFAEEKMGITEDGEKVDYLEIQIFNVDNKPKVQEKPKAKK